MCCTIYSLVSAAVSKLAVKFSFFLNVYIFSEICLNSEYIYHLINYFFFSHHHRQVLEDMEMLSAFTGVLHVPNLSSPEHVMAVLEESDVFSKRDLQKIQQDIRGAK